MDKFYQDIKNQDISHLIWLKKYTGKAFDMKNKFQPILLFLDSWEDLAAPLHENRDEAKLHENIFGSLCIVYRYYSTESKEKGEK